MQALSVSSARCASVAGLRRTLVPFKQAPICGKSAVVGLQRQQTVAVSALFNFGSKAPASKAPVKPKRETVIPAPSFNLQIALLGIAGFAAYENVTPVAVLFGLLGVFLTIQATRIQFVFDDEALSVLRSGKESDNVVVGGLNRWTYDSFINWEFWFPGFPILVYFKENQTKPEGQIHFFPIIFNGKQLYDVMLERCGPTATSGPKDK